MNVDEVVQSLDLAQAAAMAQAQQPRFLLYESAGLFWLGAEILILAAVIIGRRRMAHGPPLAGPLRRDEQRIFVLGAIFVALLAALVLGRHYVLLQPYELIEGGAANLAAAVALYKTRLLQHLAIWACFVVLWVLLEAAIVFQGWRGYRSLRAMLDVPEGRRPSRGGAAPLVVAVIAALLVARAAQAGPVAALEAAQADAMPYYNALYLLLRIAGAAWVAIEWVAAGILLRSFLLLRRAMEGGQ